jgi:hypothetical protein
MNNFKIFREDLIALEKVLELINLFYDKNLIRKSKYDFEKLKRRIYKLKESSDSTSQSSIKKFKYILKRLRSIIKRDCIPDIYFLVGGHGGIIIQDIGFCEFDSPLYTFDKLIANMNLARKNQIPYNLEIATYCLEYLNKKYPEKFSKFLELVNKEQFEIINPSYSQPYNLIIGAESNVKQFEYGLRVLKKLGLKNNIYYCSEVSLHPQIPQILKNFKINYGSLRTRIFGTTPSSHSGLINWVGLDNTKIMAITEQSGIYNGEYWHRAFYQEIPNLLFQAVSRPFMKYIIYSSIEDCVNPLPLQEEIWRISKFSDLLGKFISFSDLINRIKIDGEFKYKRDHFYLGEEIFNKSNLFLNNNKCEAKLLIAEILNSILSLFNDDSEDEFFEQSWHKLLLTQAHDNYAVPFIKTGDYSAQHLTRKDFIDLDITTERISISELSISIQNEIQKENEKFIKKSLIKISNHLEKKSEDNKNKIVDFFIFNPTIYNRKDIVNIPIKLENPLNYVLLNDQSKSVHFAYSDSVMKFIPEVQPMGYVIYSLKETDKINLQANSNFLYDITISNDQKVIEIKFDNLKVYELKFKTIQDYRLNKIKEKEDNIEKITLIEGKLKSKTFNLKIVQYNDLNRLEFQINAIYLEELILTPAFQILKTYIDYPFGIEETKRTKIQSLNLLGLIGDKKGVIYLQRNSQLFKIDRETFEIRNVFRRNGIYEISISILNKIDFYSLYREIYLYKLRLLGIVSSEHSRFIKKSDSFFSIKPPIILTNLWRRTNNNYLRILNPDLKENMILLEGKLLKKSLKLIDFNYNILEKYDNKESIIKPWEIQTFKF